MHQTAINRIGVRHCVCLQGVCLLVSTISLTAFRPCGAAVGTKWFCTGMWGPVFVTDWDFYSDKCQGRSLLHHQVVLMVNMCPFREIRSLQGVLSKYIVSLVFFFFFSFWLSASPSLPPFVHHRVCSTWQYLLNCVSSFPIMLSKVTYPFLLSEKANILDSSNYKKARKTFAEIVRLFFRTL